MGVLDARGDQAARRIGPDGIQIKEGRVAEFLRDVSARELAGEIVTFVIRKRARVWFQSVRDDAPVRPADLVGLGLPRLTIALFIGSAFAHAGSEHRFGEQPLFGVEVERIPVQAAPLGDGLGRTLDLPMALREGIHCSGIDLGDHGGFLPWVIADLDAESSSIFGKPGLVDGADFLPDTPPPVQRDSYHIQGGKDGKA